MPDIKLYFSHSVEHLATQLHRHLKSERTDFSSLLKSQEVIVPNGNMQQYLQTSFARKDGICANIEFPFLETGLFQLLSSCYQSEQQITQLNQTDLALRIWQRLYDIDLLDDELYCHIKRYLSVDDTAALLSKKRWQLSQRLALLLLDYELKRPEMILAWLKDKRVFKYSRDTRLIALENMQADLYMWLCQNCGQQKTLFQLWNGWQASSSQQTASVHLFTPNRLSQLHRQVLLDLSKIYQIHIYSLNVCAEYWQDVSTLGEDIWRKRLANQQLKVTDMDGQTIAADDMQSEVFLEMDDELVENPLLKSWGKPGREVLKLYSDLEDDAIHFDVAFSDEWLDSEQERSDHMLHMVQDAILFRASGDQEITEQQQLDSLQVIKAPSIEREVEAVYHDILFQLGQNAKWQPADIAVLVTDITRYRFVIEQVFSELNRQTGADLPFTLIDVSVNTESHYSRAVIGLMALITGGFKRGDFFEWLRNPCVMFGLGISEIEWDQWLRAVDQLGIFAGFDQLYEGETWGHLFTWKQGLQRLHRFLANDEEDHSGLDAESIGKLSVLLNYLHQQQLQWQHNQSVIDWVMMLSSVFEYLLSVPDDLPNELHVQMSLMQSLQRLTQQVSGLRLSFDDMYQFIEAELQGLSASGGYYATAGVVCAALQSMRPIPFKATYVLGLDGHTFPGQLRHETLDLTARSRRIGDINGIENKQYLFLETLMCSRDKLWLSYVGEDLKKNETVEPSSVIVELLSFCDTFLDHQSLEINSFPVFEIPLDMSTCFTEAKGVLPDNLLVNHNPWDELRILAKYGETEAMASALAYQDHSMQAFRQAADWYLSSSESESSDDTELKDIIDIDIKELASFLEQASVEYLTRQGMMIKPIDHVALAAHEPLVMSPLQWHFLFEQALQDVLTGQLDLMTSLKKHYKQSLERSDLPLPQFVDWHDWQSLADDEVFQSMCEAVSLMQAQGPWQWGEAQTRETPDVVLPAVTIVLNNQRTIRLHGVAEGFFEADGMIQAQFVVSGGKSASWHKNMIKPFLSWCLMQLSEHPLIPESLSLYLLFSNQCISKKLRYWSTDAVSFASQSSVRRYLCDLVSLYLENQGSFLTFKQINQLKTNRDMDVPFEVPYLKKSSKAKTVHPFAYRSWSDEVVLEQQRIYQNSIDYAGHLNIANLAEKKALDSPLVAMYQRFWPLHAMMMIDWEHQS